MTKCKVCGFRLSDEAKKCPICGTMKGSTKAGSMGAENANLPRYFCPSCKAEIIGEHRFCSSCGKELSEVANMQDTKEQSKNNCLKCGTYLPIGAKFCSECGAKHGINCHSCGATLSLNAKFCYECGAKQEQSPTAEPIIDNAGNVSKTTKKETPMEAFEYEKRGNEYVLKKLKDTSLTDVVIPKVFSEIGKNAFSECSNLETITIPDSVTKIGDCSFRECSNLKSITIPDSVTEIGVGAFFGCYFLRDITIPNSVTKIGCYAFACCSGLKSITIPNSITKILEWAFAGCSGLTSVTIPNSVTKIGEEAFWGCSGLTTLTIPASVTEIGLRAFQNCSGLTTLVIQSSIITMDYEAFFECNSLKDVSIENPNFKKSDITRVFGVLPSFSQIKIGNKIVKISDLK